MSYRSAADEQGTARTLRRTSSVLRKPVTVRGNFLTFTQMLNNCQHQKVACGAEEEKRGTDGNSRKKSNDLRRIVAGWLL